MAWLNTDNKVLGMNFSFTEFIKVVGFQQMRKIAA